MIQANFFLQYNNYYSISWFLNNTNMEKSSKIFKFYKL